MLRPSIARELAIEKDSKLTRANIDKQAASPAAPRTIAKPLLKRIMKREQERQEAANMIHVVTVREEIRSEPGEVSQVRAIHHTHTVS